jgi:hypothetical protein
LNFPVIYSQEQEKGRYVQVSGIVTDVTNRPVQGVSVISRKLRRATETSLTGIYSITSTPGDTIMFRALGYKRYHTIIPETYTENHATADIILEADTIQIEAVTILPWKTYSEFLMDMTRERPVDPIIANMNDNLASIYVSIANQTGVKVAPEAGYRYSMDQNFNNTAIRGQYPSINLLNPFAWAKFISSMKDGSLLKNQKIDRPSPAKVRKKRKRSD